MFDRHLVYVLGLSAAAVVLDTLSNFVYFVANQKTFQQWCISDGLAQIQSNSNMDAALPIVSDYYNCQRLFNDEVKWSLLCVILMFLLYVSGSFLTPLFPHLSFIIDPLDSLYRHFYRKDVYPHGSHAFCH